MTAKRKNNRQPCNDLFAGRRRDFCTSARWLRRYLLRQQRDSFARSEIQYLLRAALLSVLSMVRLLWRRVLLRKRVTRGWSSRKSDNPIGVQRTARPTDTPVCGRARHACPERSRMGARRSCTAHLQATAKVTAALLLRVKRADSNGVYC